MEKWCIAQAIPLIAAFFPISALFSAVYLLYEPYLDFDGTVGLSWLAAALTSLFADDMAIDGITLERGPVGLGSLPSACLEETSCCKASIESC